MEEKYCKDCAHFHQHYGLDEKKLFRVFCGHCTANSRVRKRQPDAPACDLFAAASPSKDAFVTKEYLSRTLVEYMMRLELLPPILDAQDK